MAFQENSQPRQRQASEIALILCLLAGALAFIVTLGGLLFLDLSRRAEPYLTGHNDVDIRTQPTNAPRLETRVDGNQSNIVEVDAAGAVVRAIHSSEIKDRVVSFTLFAVPQTDYDGRVYVQSTQDAQSGTLIVYPLEVVSGKLSPAIINIPSSATAVSPDQSHVASISLSPTKTITAFELATGTAVTSWTLAPNERISNDPATWISNACFELVVSTSSGSETRTFCLPL